MQKSLNDIWEQMQAQRIAEQQARAEQERAIYEQRERARQDYLQRIRIYESLNNSVASSSAAGGSNVVEDNSINSFVENNYIENYFE